MKNQFALNSRQNLFVVKFLSCIFGLLVFGLIFASPASMQNANKTATNRVVVVNNSARRMANMPMPTPELPKATVRGRVFYEDTGRVVKRTSIMLMTREGSGREPSGLTDGNGNFEIKDVPAGTYYAFVNAPGVISPLAYADISKRGKEGIEDAVEGFQPIVVNGISDIDVQVSARRGGAISGRVMYSDGDAAIGVRVEVLRKVNGKFLAVIPNFSSIVAMMTGAAGGSQTDDRGVYRFAGLPAGEYVVKVTENVSHGENAERSYDPFSSLFSNSSMLTMFYPDVLKSEKAQIINVALGQEQPEINVYIPDRELFRVEGKVVSAKDNTPLKNAKIFIKSDSEDKTFSIFDQGGRMQKSVSTDEQGNWYLKELPKGNYTLTIEPPYAPDYEISASSMSMNSNVYTTNRISNNPPKPQLAKKTQQIVIEDRNLSDVIVALGYGGTISGNVTTENSGEMPGSINLSVADEENDEISKNTSIYNGSSEDRASSQKLKHDFKIEGVSEGKMNFHISTNDDDFYVKSATLDGADLLAKPLELKEGDNLRNVKIVLSKDVGTLKGKVLNDQNLPAARTRFSLVPIDAAKRKNSTFYRQVATDENGEFEVKLAPGEYAIMFFDEEMSGKKGEEFDKLLDEKIKDTKKVTVKANEIEKVSLSTPK